MKRATVRDSDTAILTVPTPTGPVTKQFTVGVKAANDKTRTIQLAITTFAVDRSGEVVLPKGGRFEDYLQNPIVLFGHNSHDLPVGACLELAASEKDVLALTRFAGLDQLHPFAETVYRLYRDGFMRASSVGFQPVTVSQDKMLPGQTGITYREWNLLEYSCVAVPANPQALMRMMKAYALPSGATEQDLEEAILVRPKTWFDIANSIEKSAVPSVIKAEWSAAYINDLPDSSFAYIEDGGTKDDEGKTTPRSLRHLPYKDADGALNGPHIRNALARLSGTKIPADKKPGIKAKLTAALAKVNGSGGGKSMTSLVARMLGLFKNPMPNADDYEDLAAEFLQASLIPPEFRAYTSDERLVLAAVYEVPETIKDFETGVADAWFLGRKIHHGDQILVQLTQTTPDEADKDERLFMLLKPPTPGKDAVMRLMQVTDEMQESLAKGLGKPRQPPLPDPDPMKPEPTIAQQVHDLVVARSVSRAIRKAMGEMDDEDEAQDEAEEVVILDTMSQLLAQMTGLMKTLNSQHAGLVALQTAGDDPDLEDVKEIAALQLFELSIRQAFATLGALCAQSCYWLREELSDDFADSMVAPSGYSGSVIDGMVIKAGRVLSGKNLSKLKQAATHIADVIDDHEARMPKKPSDAIGHPGNPVDKNAPNPNETPDPSDDVKPVGSREKPAGAGKKPKPDPSKPGDQEPGPGDTKPTDAEEGKPSDGKKKGKKPVVPGEKDDSEGQAGGSDGDDTPSMSVDEILGKIFTDTLFPVH